jgi:deoxyhypusine synthase
VSTVTEGEAKMPHDPEQPVHSHHNHTENVHSTPTMEEYLGGAPIIPERISTNMSAADLIDIAFQAYNAGRLNEACRLFATKMMNPDNDVTVAMTVAGAMTPAGIGGAIITLMEYGAIDLLISTGANLYHDIHYALAFTLHRGRFDLSDVALQEAGVIRIYDVLFPDQVLLDTDAWIREQLKTFPQRPMSTSELHYLLGQRLLDIGVKPEDSVVAQAAKWGVPIYTSSPGDSSIGMNLARHQLDGNALTIDPLLDVHETTAIVLDAKKNGVVILGGGSPKNFYLQTQPQLWEVLGINKGGHDYFIQLTTDAPHWGGLSGATPSEAVSWGKIKPDQLPDTVVVYGDSTISFPLLTAYTLSRAEKRPLKRLYDRREQLIANLRDGYQENARKESSEE